MLTSLLLTIIVNCQQLVTPPPTPTFELVNITNDPWFSSHAVINNCGEIAFHIRLQNIEQNTELFLYDNGITQQLTDTNVWSGFPSINEDGDIAYVHAYNPWAYGIVALWQHGSTTFVAEGIQPHLSNVGDIVFDVWEGSLDNPIFTNGKPADLWLYQEGAARFFYGGTDLINQTGIINDAGDIVWMEMDPDAGGPSFFDWESTVYLYRDGQIQPLTTFHTQSQSPSFTPDGGVVINYSEFLGGIRQLWRWDEIPGPGYLWVSAEDVAPSLNPGGKVNFNRHGDGVFWVYSEAGNDFFFHIWIKKATGELYPLTDNSISTFNVDPDINDFGEVVFLGQKPFTTDVYMMRRVRTGDMPDENALFNGSIDLRDAARFLNCYTGSGDFARLCDCRFVDLDHDRDVDGQDAKSFMTAISGPASP